MLHESYFASMWLVREIVRERPAEPLPPPVLEPVQVQVPLPVAPEPPDQVLDPAAAEA